jgi:hypothetical protein
VTATAFQRESDTSFNRAEVTSIEGQDPYAYVSQVATNYSGNYLDHGIRENSVYSSYRYTAGKWGQRVGGEYLRVSSLCDSHSAS